MTTSIDLKNHFCLQHADFLKQVNKPLTHLGLDAFCYTRVNLKTSERFVLTDHPHWTHFAYNSNFYGSEIVKKIEMMNLVNVFLWSDFAPNKEYNSTLQEAKNHGLCNGITLIHYTEDYANMYYASASRALEDERILLNIQEQLKDFIPYFHYSARKLINESRQHEFIVRKSQELEIETSSESEIHKFYEAIKYKQLVINEQGDTLSHQEIMCVYLAITGHVNKKISIKLNISLRTVEKHISNARKKLGVKSNESLLGKLFSSIYFNHIIIYGKRSLQSTGHAG